MFIHVKQFECGLTAIYDLHLILVGTQLHSMQKTNVCIHPFHRSFFWDLFRGVNSMHRVNILLSQIEGGGYG